jgi:hypothetical protein
MRWTRHFTGCLYSGFGAGWMVASTTPKQFAYPYLSMFGIIVAGYLIGVALHGRPEK